MLSTKSIFDNLNEGQREVVNRTKGHVLVVAGPGSGKTLAIVRRIVHILQQGASPESVLAVTFTNRAAREMRERLHALLGATAQKVFVGTLHLLGLRIIRENFSNEFVLYNREEQANLLMPLVKDTKWKVGEIADRISYTKSLGEDPDDEIEPIFHTYQTELSARKALDFDDLILRPVELLKNAGITTRYRERFRHIIIDEYQDINPAQYRLLMSISGDKTNMCAVGDPDQAIYGFRGAEVGNFLNFKNDFAGATEISLAMNYRSTGNIVRVSDAMISKNTRRIDKTTCPVKVDGPRVVVASVPDERAEGEFIVREIESRIGGLSHYRLSNMNVGNGFSGSSVSFSDFAVIFRTNNQSETIAESLTGAGIPCRVLGSGHASSGVGLKDIISTLKEYAHSKENSVPLCELKAADFMENFSQNCPFGEDEAALIANQIKLMVGDGWDNTCARDLVDALTIFTPDDNYDPRADAVTLMTLHMAKGLEFRVVFICGVEDGLMPYRSGRRCGDLEEERRLLYVGMTRAKDELFLIHRRTSYLYGRRTNTFPSPFLSEIPEEYIRKTDVPDKPQKSHRKQQMKLF
jgi:superfamily I DNA/RNA helicase